LSTANPTKAWGELEKQLIPLLN